MKIKRFNNLWLMGLILSASILGVIYFLKICFPQFVIEVAEIDSITRIGHYIDTHKWAWYLASSILSFFIYWFFTCACCEKRTIGNKGFICVISAILLGYIIKEFFTDLYEAYNFSSLIILPAIFNAKIRPTAVCFTFLMFLQLMTLSIRNISLMISDFNFATLIILMIDYYISIGIMYLFYNYKKGEN